MHTYDMLITDLRLVSIVTVGIVIVCFILLKYEWITKFLKEHMFEILLGFLMILVIVLVLVFGVGLDCLLHGVDCPPVTNCTGCV